MPKIEAEEPSLDDFNDTLLLKMFKLFPLIVLCQMRGVSKRYRSLARQAFSKYHSPNRIKFENLITNMIETTRVICCFGRMIKSVTVDGSVFVDLNYEILSMIAEKCVNLCNLQLICFNFGKPTIAIMKRLVPRLSVIQLLYCTIEQGHGINHSVFLKHAEKLKALTIIGRDEDIDLKYLNKKLPHMDKLELISVRMDEEVCANFLRKNEQIHHFSYLPNSTKPPTQSCMEIFMKSYLKDPKRDLNNISIELTNNNDIFHLLNDMPNLQKVVIVIGPGYKKAVRCQIDPLTNAKALEVFSIWNLDAHQFAALPQLSRVKTLEIREMISLMDRKLLADGITKQWTTVKSLYVDHSIVRDADDLGILVKNLPNVRNLMLSNMKGFFVMPSILQYMSWLECREKSLRIYIDSRYMMQCPEIMSRHIVFKPFKNRIVQNMNVTCKL